jgi:phosphoribosylanthranilate isomerase
VSVRVKICGLKDAASVAASVTGGANYLGFVFYPPSPRAVDAATAATLIAVVPASIISVGLFVDPSDDDLQHILKTVPLRMIQLHGKETPDRVAAVKKLTGLPVMKAIGIAAAEDVTAARIYENAADMLLLDAKPVAGDLPGGNAARFDWALLRNARFTKPWMLAGGLTEQNIAEAVKTTGAKIVDVSSGVESQKGVKSLEKITRFLRTARAIETSS